MNLFHSVWFMIAGSFFIQFVLMSLIMSNSISNITFSVGKFYISVIMALLMGILEVFMHDSYSMSGISAPYYLSLTFALCVFLYLYRSQTYIYEKQYLEEMIEHHSMALLTSEEIQQKTNNERVKKLAENIVTTQEAEIKYMKQLIKSF